jgi:hypothetical protein
MRRVYDDQTIEKFGMSGRESPGADAAPIMRHQRRRRVAERPKKLPEIFNEARHSVGFNAGGLVREVIAAHVERDCEAVLGEFAQLVLPGAPEFGETMHEHDRLAAAG